MVSMLDDTPGTTSYSLWIGLEEDVNLLLTEVK
jgi:hypothetical protein